MSFIGPHYARTDEHWMPRHFGNHLVEHGDEARWAGVPVLAVPRRELGLEAKPDPDVIARSSIDELYRTKVRCPGCRRQVMAAVLVDVRHLPGVVRQGQEWACDGCWTLWIRGRPVDSVGRPSARQRCSEAELVALHGAPRVLVEYQVDLHRRRREAGWPTEHRVADIVDVEDLWSIPAAPRWPADLPWCEHPDASTGPPPRILERHAAAGVPVMGGGR